MSISVRTGLDVILTKGLRLPREGRAALLCNSATVDSRLRGAPRLLQGGEVRGARLVRLFSPQHGFAGEKQDNMIESRDGLHPGTGLPMFSLYGRVREPEPSMLDGLDAVLIDLPDVGTRVYTFLSPALLMMRAAARAGIPAIILDRPNPIGGDEIEGPVLEPEFESFVGMIPIPLRHGLTAGEYCRFGAHALGLDLDLEVIQVEGWRRPIYHDETDLPWVIPSPNLPTLESAVVYPGQVMLEGTALSEGRGTTRPFEMWGSPGLDCSAVLHEVERETGMQGFRLREVAFEPTFQKFTGETVRGFQIHVSDRRGYRPVRTTVAILSAVRRVHPDRILWRDPPYEYETGKLPIDLIAGTDRLRRDIDAGRDLAEIEEGWGPGLARFREASAPFLLYR
jgi:uncharacterized protein YbbC (DUF1343 family)